MRMTSTTRIALVLGVLAAGMLVPAAAGQQFRANVVSWSPNLVHAGEPVSVVLTLHAEPAQGAKIRADGRRDVAVVIRGNGQTRRFGATTLGSGRYRATIVFPDDGSWRLQVQYPGGETGLGKGGACVGDCADAEGSPAIGDAAFPIGVTIAGGVVLTVAALVAAAGRRRRMSRIPG
jgi:hypothetical protein